MVTVRLREHVKLRLTCQVVKGSRRVDQTPVKEYPSCWAIGGGSAIGNSELDGAPCEGGSVYPRECRSFARQLLADDSAARLFNRGVSPPAELRHER